MCMSMNIMLVRWILINWIIVHVYVVLFLSRIKGINTCLVALNTGIRLQQECVYNLSVIHFSI